MTSKAGGRMRFGEINDHHTARVLQLRSLVAPFSGKHKDAL